MSHLDFWSILLLAIAFNFDGLNVGITYGLRNIEVGIFPLLMISGISALSIFITSTIGANIASIISINMANTLGSILLMAIGVWLIYSAYLENGANTNEVKEYSFKLEIKSLNVIIKILKKPTSADLDESGSINNLESIFLGLALALDSMGAGLGIGISGLANPFIPLVLGTTTFIMIYGGYLAGKQFGDVLPDYFSTIPGFVIILLAFLKII